MADRLAAFRLALVLVAVLALGAGANMVRETLPDGATATLRNGRVLFLECTPPAGEAAKACLAKYLKDPASWRVYAQKGAVAIPFGALNDATRRAVLLGLFPGDFVDEAGWHHVVRWAEGEEGREALWTWCEWLTGRGTNCSAVAEANRLKQTALRRDQQVVFPRSLLLDAMKVPTPARKPTPVESPEEQSEPLADLSAAGESLRFGAADGKDFAVYRLKPGEALYTAVVVRFTDCDTNEVILEACERIRQASGIKDVHHMKPGTEVRIPVEMLSDRFKPESSPERREYEAGIQEARRLKGERVRTKDLEGVVIVLDPGHGGRDQGARNDGFGLYEDELSYDIVCRIKRILEKETRARVYVTMRDKSDGYSNSDRTRFEYDKDEVVLTTPPYANQDAKVSANLRWYLADAIYRREVKGGADPRRILFTSIHCDALFDGRLRGAMIYIPGARLRREREGGYSDPEYRRFKEVKEQGYATSTAAERKRDEALSRNFAETLLEELGRKRIKRHGAGDPIRSQIRQDGGRVYVPAVLRNTMIPTKVLVECANMTSEADCQRLADPRWRQSFAEACVGAIESYFGS